MPPFRLALLAAFAILLSAPAALADGEIQLTHAKALAGNVTPGDPPGYPIVLTLPGTYKFAGNIHPSADTIGIQIASQDITVDLNGFRLHGSTTALFGVAGAANNVTIKNGTITGFKYDGIFATGDFWRVADMQIMENGRDGIKADDNFRADRNTISRNQGTGLQCDSFCHVEGNLVSESGGIGINVSSGMVLGNTIINNTSYGLYMFYGAFGNNTLILNNNNQAGAQILGAVYQLNPNFCNPACPP